jgi:hypothetical protein
MNGRKRTRISLLLYMLADVPGILAVGHPTSFGLWTLVGCALVYLELLALASEEWVKRMMHLRGTS